MDGNTAPLYLQWLQSTTIANPANSLCTGYMCAGAVPATEARIISISLLAVTVHAPNSEIAKTYKNMGHWD